MCSKVVAMRAPAPPPHTHFTDRQLPVPTLLYLATLGGADVCNIASRTGSLEPGKAFDALVVNVGRGAVVDTEALTAEVTAGRLHAALDVVDPEPLPAGHPLWSAPNALITPHVGGNASAFEPRIVEHLRRTLGQLARGEEPPTQVRAAAR